MSSTQNGIRLGNFDTLRLVFSVLVIYSHSYVLGNGLNLAEPLGRLTGGKFSFGSLSVCSFFVISGFLITQSWTRSPSPIKYLRRRVARIYPGFIVAGLFGALIVLPLATDRWTFPQVSPLDFLLQTLRLQEFHYTHAFAHNAYPNALNASLWSIPYEFWCYIGVMSLGMVRGFRRRWVVVLLFAAVEGWHLCLLITGWKPEGKLFTEIFGQLEAWMILLPFFLAGAIFHLYGGPVLLRRRLLIASAIILVASIYIPHVFYFALHTCGSYLLFGLAYYPRLHPLNLGRYGDFSYGTYLYAFPVQQLIVKFGGGSMAPLKLFLLSAPMSLLVGALSWFLVERHFLARSTLLKHEGKEVVRANS